MSENLTFEAILSDCNVSMADFLGPDASQAFVTVHKFLADLAADVQRTAETDSDKEDPAYVKAWKDDGPARIKADEIVLSIVEGCEQYENDPALMYHLREAFRATVVKYLSTEVEYQSWKAEKAAPSAAIAKGTRAVNRERFQVGKVGLTNLLNLVGHNLTLPTDVLIGEGKNLAPNLPKLQGNYGGNGASGVNAKLYRLSYNVEGVTTTDPREAVRMIWTRADRIGKTTTDLANLIESKAKNVYGSDKPCKFVGPDGASITVVRVTDK